MFTVYLRVVSDKSHSFEADLSH